jgi:hypothetical protein
MNYAWALFVLVGISVLRPAFAGNARQWWLLALGLQLWSYGEHFLLVVQLGTDWRLAHEPLPIIDPAAARAAGRDARVLQRDRHHLDGRRADPAGPRPPHPPVQAPAAHSS